MDLLSSGSASRPWPPCGDGGRWARVCATVQAVPGRGSEQLRRRAVVAGALLLGLSLVAALANAALLAVERPVSDAVRGGALVVPFRLVTILGATEFTVLAGGSLAGLLWRRCRIHAVLLPLTLLAGTIVNVAMKSAVDRPRPVAPRTGVALASFPSGHTLQATLLFGLLPLAAWQLSRSATVLRVTSVLAGAGVLAVAASRVCLGAHWPTDTLAAVLVGTVMVLGVEWVLHRHHRGDRCGCALHPIHVRSGLHLHGPHPRPAAGTVVAGSR